MAATLWFNVRPLYASNDKFSLESVRSIVQKHCLPASMNSCKWDTAIVTVGGKQTGATPCFSTVPKLCPKVIYSNQGVCLLSESRFPSLL